MRGITLSRVLASKNPNVKEGDIVNASIGWTEVAVAGEKEFQKLEVPKGGQITDLLGVLGTCRYLTLRSSMLYSLRGLRCWDAVCAVLDIGGGSCHRALSIRPRRMFHMTSETLTRDFSQE